ncbi:MAG: MATE family efflux transporter [Chlamydiota bacterium]|nr:MATE family efflux transporter [Chlamydiota bacterium]
MNLTEGDIKEHVKNIAIPASVGFFFSTMFNIVDTFFAGQISTDALASLSISFPIFFIILAFSQGVSTGASALISNALGANLFKEAQSFKAQCISYGCICSLIATTVGLLVSPPLFEILGASGHYLELALSYINIIFLGSVFFLLNSAANAILLAHGNSKTMRNVLIIGFLLNCLLDPLLLYGGLGIPPLGLRGIALATVLGMIVSCTYIVIRVVVEGHLKGCSFSDFIPNRRVFYLITQQSLPAAVNMMSIALGIFVVTFYVKGFGSESVAAYGIGMRIQQIFLLPTIGITIAVLSIIGQNNGASRFDRIEESMSISLKYGNRVMTVGAVLMFFFPELLMGVFTEEKNVIADGVTYLRVASLCSWGYLMMSVYVSALQGMKRPNFPFILTMIRQIFLPIVVFYVVIHFFNLGIISLWISILMITWTAALVLYLYTRYLLRHEKERTQEVKK